MDPITLLTAFMPMITDGARGLINKFTGGAGAKPANVEEAIQMIDADIKKLQAMAELDKVGDNVSQWVSNIRAMQRPVFVSLIMVSWLVMLFIHGDINPDEVIRITSNLASSAAFYILGDRTYMYFKKDKG